MADWGGGGLALAFWIGATKYAVLLVQGNCDSDKPLVASCCPLSATAYIPLHCSPFNLVDAADKTMTHLVESINRADREHRKQENRKIRRRTQTVKYPPKN